MSQAQCQITPKKGQQNHLELLPKAAAKSIPEQEEEPLPFICLIHPVPLLKTGEKLLHKSPSWQVDVLMLTLPSHLHTKIQQQVLVGECMCQISSTALLFRTSWQQSSWILAEWIISSAQFYPGNKQVLNCNNRIHLLLEFNVAPLSWNSWLLL